ncbi:unnamed protein product [Victoria cruziana]
MIRKMHDETGCLRPKNKELGFRWQPADSALIRNTVAINGDKSRWTPPTAHRITTFKLTAFLLVILFIIFLKPK